MNTAITLSVVQKPRGQALKVICLNFIINLPSSAVVSPSENKSQRQKVMVFCHILIYCNEKRANYSLVAKDLQ